MLFSFVVPIYNVEQYVARCIESLIAQTYKDIEIVLVDDGSRDSSYEICEEYRKKDPRIFLYKKENGGLSDARNFGSERAHGDYIIYVDSDDYIDLQTCEKLLPYTEKSPDIIRGNAMRVEAESGLLCGETLDADKVYSGTEYLKTMMQGHGMPMAAWLNIFRREFLVREKLEFKKGILHEDEEFTPRAYLKAEKVIDTGIPFYYYVIRENSIMTAKDKRRNARDMLSTGLAYEEMLSSLPDKQLKEMILDSLVGKYLSIYQSGDLRRYGKEYLPRKFLLRNAHSKKTRLKAWLVCISPKLYSFVHSKLK